MCGATIFLALFLGAPATWTVDDDGPADFPSIASAVFQAQTGDVLLVEPGSYGPFVVVGKRLSILGPASGARPKVLQKSYVLGAPAVTIAGLELESLTVEDVVSRALVDDCEVTQGDFQVKGCGAFLLSRTKVRSYVDGDAGVEFNAGKAFVMLCDVEGGAGEQGSPFGGFGGDGGAGVLVRSGGFVTIVASTLVGGDAGIGTTDGRAGDGLRVDNGTVLVRGAPTDALEGGFYSTCCGATPGKSIFVAAGATVVWSGASLPSGIGGAGTVQQAPVAEPYLYLTGSDVPGQSRVLRLLGAPGLSGIVIASLSWNPTAVPSFEDLLWPNPAAPCAVWAATTPSSVVIALPSALGFEGLCLQAQAGFPGVASTLVPGAAVLTNPAALIMRF
ncbi:MAG: hypothetical protein HY812_18120 [Planctomycetes bacterium]|nr:hypothetical protein [Planctomycetota bacterium]